MGDPLVLKVSGEVKGTPAPATQLVQAVLCMPALIQI